MNTESRDRIRPRLARPWRRGLVITLGSSATLLAISNFSAVDPRPFGPLISVGFAALVIVSLWLLSDELWPWFGGGAADPQERAVGDGALRSSYAALLTVVFALVIYLHTADSRPELLPEQAHRGVAVLWTFIGLVVLLPISIVSWAGTSARPDPIEIGPLALVRRRFTGPSRGLYLGGALSVATAAALLVFGYGVVGRPAGRLFQLSLLVAVGLVAAVSLLLLRLALSQRQSDAYRR